MVIVGAGSGLRSCELRGLIIDRADGGVLQVDRQLIGADGRRSGVRADEERCIGAPGANRLDGEGSDRPAPEGVRTRPVRPPVPHPVRIARVLVDGW